MKKNVGTNDAVTRIGIGLILLALWGFKVVSGTFAIVLLVIAGIFVLTALFRYCPLYGILGVNSCKQESK